MGVFKMFSSSSFDKSDYDMNMGIGSKVNNSVNENPDPRRYVIYSHIQYRDILLVKIRYLDCNNFEGIKILVFRCSLLDLKQQVAIDPHFSENKDYESPIARFEPTEEGWDNGMKFILLIGKYD